MTVQQMINILSKYPGSYPLVFKKGDGQYEDAAYVIITAIKPFEDVTLSAGKYEDAEDGDLFTKAICIYSSDL